MPRSPRQIEPGCGYHLISRFVDRDWFIKTEQERRNYLALLGRALTASDWLCLAYAIMSNHIHLSLVAGRDSLDSWVRRVHAPFADAMNRAYDRIGPMFVRGPKLLLAAPDRVGNVIAYIHNNPVRAKLADDASGSTWTSHRAYLGLAATPRWLQVGEGLKRAGFEDAAAFHRWVSNQQREDFEKAYDVAITADGEERPKRASPAIDAVVLVTEVASAIGIPVDQLRSRRRSEVEVLGREVVVLCAQRAGLRGADVARVLGVSQQAVSLIAHRGVRMQASAITARVLQRLELPGR